MDVSDLDPDPLAQFNAWFDPADASVCLATAAGDGEPDARMVLLKGADERGFAFFTNERSAKGAQLAANPRAALVFHWPALGLQVRVRGDVVAVPADECDAYWQTRPRGSQLGAWASEQSTVIADRQVLEDRLATIASTYPGDVPVPRPAHWRGYRVVPREYEFWCHRDDRLHDRVRYRRGGDGWVRERLSP